MAPARVAPVPVGCLQVSRRPSQGESRLTHSTWDGTQNFEIRELRLPKTLPKGRCAAELHRLLLGRSWWVRFEVAIHAGAASDLSSELHSFEWSKTNSNPKSQSNKQDTAGLLPFQQSVEQQLQVAEGPSLISKPRCRRWAFPPGPSTTSPTMPFGDRRRRRPLLLAMRQDLGSVL